MTPKQKAALDFIRAYIDRHEYAPTLDEITAALGLSPKSKSTAHRIVQELERQGAITKGGHHPRSLAIPRSTQAVARDELYQAILIAHGMDDGEEILIVCTLEELQATLRKVLG